MSVNFMNKNDDNLFECVCVCVWVSIEDKFRIDFSRSQDAKTVTLEWEKLFKMFFPVSVWWNERTSEKGETTNKCIQLKQRY